MFYRRSLGPCTKVQLDFLSNCEMLMHHASTLQPKLDENRGMGMDCYFRLYNDRLITKEDCLKLENFSSGSII